MKRSQATGFLTAALGIAVLALAGCESPNTFAPDVEMTMGIPLLDERIEIGERVLKADSVRLSPDDPTQMQIYFEQTNVEIRDDGYIGQDRLDVAPQDRQTSSYEVGLIEIDDIPPESSDPIYLTETFPALNNIPVGVDSVPFSGNVVPMRSQDLTFEKFETATFSDQAGPGLNRLRISFANRSPLHFSDVSIYLSSTGNTNTDGSPVMDDLLIDPVTFLAVAPAESLISDPEPLANITIPGTIYLMYEMTADAGNIPSDKIPGAYIRLVTDITGLEVTSAKAAVPPQDFSKTREIEFASTELDLYKVVLADMGVDYQNVYEFNLTNTLPTNVDIHYQLPNFLHIPKAPAGDVATLEPDNTDNYSSGTIHAAPNQTLQIKFLLDGATFESQTSFALDKVSITFTVNIRGSDGNYVQIDQNDGLELESFINQLAIARVEGRVPDDKPIEQPIAPFDMDIDEDRLPAGLSGLKVTNIAVEMDVNTQAFTSTFYTDMKMRVNEPVSGTQTAFYEREISEQLTLNKSVHYRLSKDSIGTQGNSPVDIINATLDNLFDSGESTINVEGSLTVTGEVTLVRDSSRVQIPDMTLLAGMQFEVPASITFDAKSETNNGYNPGLSDEVRNDFIPRTVKATMFAEIENHFPSGGTLVMFASPDPLFKKLRREYPAENQDDVLTMPDKIPGSVDYGDEVAAIRDSAVFKLFTISLPEPTLLPDGSVDPANPGRNTDPIEVLLDDELPVFEYENLYLLPRIQLRHDGPTVVQFRPSDHLKVSLMMFLTAQSNEVEDTP